MDKVDNLYNKLQEFDNKKVNGILKDIIVIDGAIVQDSNLEYKRDIYLTINEKYKNELRKLKYEKVISIVDEKVDEYVESNIKEINTILGTLKTMLIRLAGINLYSEDKINEILSKIEKEDKKEQIYKLYEKLDNEITNNIK